ncbi:hypothetical protein QR680_012153 [Steinernema hermaphroditum]|uniref:BEACH domain-containing protein n=1 Tax=Steinernema hermaphroditum TaxID=289476 RepID=A0AA39I2P0_9BILA|nr:hypothetical protein QR680_012153 [Steinernema hermaphroditum]
MSLNRAAIEAIGRQALRTPVDPSTHRFDAVVDGHTLPLTIYELDGLPQKIHLETPQRTTLLECDDGPSISKEPIRLIREVARLFSFSWITFDADSQVEDYIWRPITYHSHIAPPICAVEHETKPSRIIYAKIEGASQTLHDVSLYAHHNYSVDSQVFNLLSLQLIHLFHRFAQRQLYPLLSLRSLNVDSNLWITANLHDILATVPFDIPSSSKAITLTSTESSISEPVDIETISERWRIGAISNYDYLLALNHFAGRKRCDIYNYPIFPWVCEFTSSNGGWRPLSKTKYRLKKGDDQLNLQYTKGEPAHHVPELLSEIGYMVYRARVEKKEDLCRHWVPEEYPSSMLRLYMWTPEECIPDLFEDASLFHSIHPDMTDIELPSWTADGAEFVKWHRSMLESDEVSDNLHLWIDLAFGYLLSGPDAVDAFNVHLSFMQKPVSGVRLHGAVQLFERPHPRRAKLSLQEISGVLMKAPKYNPAYLSHFSNEEMREESEKLGDVLKEIYEKTSQSCRKLRLTAQSAVVCIIELAVAPFCRNLSESATFEDRLNRAKSLLASRLYMIPRHMRQTIKHLLSDESAKGFVKSSDFDLVNRITNPLNIPLIAFGVHDKLTQLYAVDQIAAVGTSTDTRRFFLEKIDILLDAVEFSHYGEMWINIFVQLLQRGGQESVTVCYRLFGRVAEYTERKQLERLVPEMKKLLEDITPHTVKLFDRRFLIQLSIRYGTDFFLNNFLPSIVEAVTSSNKDVYEVAKESIVWLTKRYGPIITTTYISSSLLRMLALCYSDRHQKIPEIVEMSLDVVSEGDESSRNAVDCLIEIAALYGSSLITMQYLPFCADLIDQALKKLTQNLESAVISAVVLLQHVCNCLSDKQLMDNLQEVIIDKVLFPAVRLFSSPSIHFSSQNARLLFACKTVRCIELLACRIGVENVQRFMSASIQRIFCTFNLIYDYMDDEEDGKLRILPIAVAPTQLKAIFTSSFARQLLQIFSCACGRQFIANSLPNAPLIFQLADVNTSGSTSSPNLLASSPTYLRHSPSQFAIASVGLGNRLSTIGSSGASMASNFDPTSNLTLNEKMTANSKYHLEGGWIARVASVLSSTSERLTSFNHIQLGAYQGHSAAVKKIAVLDNENSFISGSLDKTVKLWSVKSNEQVSLCQWTYKMHTKAIQDIWDPFRGSTLCSFEWPSGGGESSTISTLKPIDQHTLAVGNLTDNMIKILDLREGKWSYHLCVTNSSSASVRAFGVSPSSRVLAVVLSNGALSAVDVRNGKLMAFNNTHSDCIQLEWLSEDRFLTIHTDHPVCSWTITPENGVNLVRKLPETASLAAKLSGGQFATVQVQNKLRIYDDDVSVVDTKLKSDFFAGSLCSVGYLPLNKILLFGSTNGSIKLVC